MEQHIRDVVIECTRASDEERAQFPVIVGQLVAAGVERYHADLVRSEKTYYLPDGSNIVVPCHAVELQPAQAFSAQQVEAAVRASQQEEIGYREFCRRVVRAGCAGYWVSLVGKRAVYYGRTGETHVERFPGSA
jgi:uncharacterized protein YbcV (DUF1398 family)